MRQKRMQHCLLILAILWVGAIILLLFISPSSVKAATVSTVARGAVIILTSPPPPSPDATLQFNGTVLTIISTIFASLMAFAATMLAVMYSSRKNRKIEIEKLRLQFQHEKDQELQKHRQELEMIYNSDLLTSRHEEREREQQRKEAASSAAKVAMKRARTASEREKAYREALHADPALSQMQILDMTRPLEVANIYVRLRLYQQTRLLYELDPELPLTKSRHNPQALLRAQQTELEKRSTMSLTPEEALQKYRLCVVVGDPGAGKSTLLKYLTLKAIDQQLSNLSVLPIHIVLGEFAASGSQDLLEFAITGWREKYAFPENEARSTLKEHLTSGHALLLLDALDETVIGASEESATASYRHVQTAINRLVTTYRNAHIVVTVRKAGYQRGPRLQGFTELEVQDFLPEEIKQFVNNWFACNPVSGKHATAADLNTKLEQNVRMQALAANPLLLSLIVMLYEMRHDLPEKRAELYKQCIDTLLFRWDTSRDIHRRRRFQPEHKQQLLEEIAWHFHQKGERYFPEEELYTLIAEFMPTIGLSAAENRLMLQEIEEENAILKAQAHGLYGFLHLTLQEYFTALYIKNNDKLAELLKHCGDPAWEEVLSLYAGSIADASLLLHTLLAYEKRQVFWKDVFHTHLIWAGHCLVAKPRIKQIALKEEVIKRLFLAWRAAENNFMRDQIIETMKNINDHGISRRFLSVLKKRQEDVDIRQRVARALGRLGERGVVQELLGVLKDRQEDVGLRQYVATALRDLGERGIVPDLLEMLKDPQEDVDVRRYIPYALGDLGGRGIIQELLGMLKDSQEDVGVRQYVARALGELGEREVAQDLLGVLKDRQEDVGVRQYVAYTLGGMGERGIVPDLLEMLKDPQEDVDVRQNVAYALGRLGARKIVPDLMSVLKNRQEDVSVRRRVAIALGRLGERRIAQDLLVVLKDRQEDVGVRQDVAIAFRELGERGVVQDLMGVFKNRQENENVRLSVALTLGILGEDEVLPYLLRSFANLDHYNDCVSLLAETDYRDLSVYVFAKLLKKFHEGSSGRAVYGLLWTISQREDVYFYIFKWKFITLVHVCKR